ncbi:hypothetical protein [Streptomyces sp. NPDC059881]|uniref:hypothetical protein n=1 Tax=Streptomyces sp. NPDC059881 TaxID=3346986 RepID=UPI003657412B
MAGSADIPYGWATEDTTGFCKMLAEPGTGRLLGARLMGAQVPTLIQPLILAAMLGIDATTLANPVLDPSRAHRGRGERPPRSRPVSLAAKEAL